MPTSKKNTCNSWLNKFFPPPAFLKMNAIGLDISDSVIRYISFKNKGTRREIDVFGEVAVPEGAMLEGHINKPNVVASVLRGVSDKLKNKFVRVSLPEEKAYIYQTQIPKAEGVDIREAVLFSLEENVPIKPSEAVFDFVIVPSPNENTDHIDVIVTVIPQKVSEIYELVTTEAGFFPISFEISSQAIARSVIDPRDNKVRLILNLNETKTGFSIVSKGLVRFTSTVSMGASQIDKTLADLMKISSNEAKEMKKKSVIEGEQNMEMISQLMEIVKPIKDEILKLESYWRTHGAGRSGLSKEIVEIIFVGRDTAVPAVAEFFETTVGIKTTVANVWDNAFSLDDQVPEIDFYHSLDYAGAIGLALGNDGCLEKQNV